MAAIKPNAAPTGDALLVETPKLSDTRTEFDFTLGAPDEKQDPVGWRVFFALMRQYRLFHGTPEWEAEPNKFPSPDGRIVSLSEITERGLSLDKLSVPASCCGK